MDTGSLVPTSLASDRLDTLALVLAGVRARGLRTRPELVRQLGLGRNVVSQRVAELIELGLFQDGSMAPSTGGRPSRELRFRSGAGCFLVAELGATHLQAALTDLDGEVLHQRAEELDISAGPEATLDRVEQLFDEILDATRTRRALVGGRGRAPGAGRVLPRSPDRATDHAGVGRLPGPGPAGGPVRSSRLGRQRRERPRPGRAASGHRPRRAGPALRQGGHRHRSRPDLGQPVAPGSAGRRR